MLQILLFVVVCLFVCLFVFPGFECEEHDNPADFFLDIIDAMEQRGTYMHMVIKV